MHISKDISSRPVTLHHDSLFDISTNEKRNQNFPSLQLLSAVWEKNAHPQRETVMAYVRPERLKI
jgi:hypothetical protein